MKINYVAYGLLLFVFCLVAWLAKEVSELVALGILYFSPTIVPGFVSAGYAVTFFGNEDYYAYQEMDYPAFMKCHWKSYLLVVALATILYWCLSNVRGVPYVLFFGFLFNLGVFFIVAFLGGIGLFRSLIPTYLKWLFPGFVVFYATSALSAFIYSAMGGHIF